MQNAINKIYRSGLKFLVPLSTEETYSIIVEEALKLANADMGSILLENNGDLQRVYSSSPLLGNIAPRKRGFIYKAFKSRKPNVLTLRELDKIHPELKKIKTHSIAHLPLSYKNKSIGVLTLLSLKREHFTPERMDILKLFASLATLAIRKTQLYDETKKALETRDLFISMAAHEFRTPLTSINGYSQLLFHKLANQNTPEARWSEQLIWECIRLTNLISGILEINKIKSGQLEYVWKECNLTEILERTINGFKFAYPKHQIIFKNDSQENKPVMVIGDFDKLLQVFSNILDNAGKFSDENSTVVVDLKVKNPYVLIKIRDQGEGIERGHIPRLFKEFNKLTGEEKRGMGTGLFLAKYIISAHHGLINIFSTKKKGTTVEIKLPEIKI
jgi:signal transduction histidine kinase